MNGGEAGVWGREGEVQRELGNVKETYAAAWENIDTCSWTGGTEVFFERC